MLTHTLDSPLSSGRVAVIGAGGFVGRAVADAAGAAGLAVTPIGRAEADLLDPAAPDRLAALWGPEDVVVFVSAKAPARNPDLVADNVTMGRHVCAAWARQPAAHLVYVSSDAVYPDDAALLSESTAPSPSSLHGVMHLAREVMLRAVCRQPLAIVRPSLLYGPADPHNGYGPNRFARLTAAGEPITLFGEGEEQRDHVLIGDVGRLILRVIQRRSAGVLNIATGEALSFRAIAEAVQARSAKPAGIKGTPRQNPITHRHFDPTAAITAFPDFVFTRFADGVAAFDPLIAAGA